MMNATAHDLTADLESLVQYVEALPPAPLRRHDMVTLDGETAEIIMIAASGNVTVRTTSGQLRTTTAGQLVRVTRQDGTPARTYRPTRRPARTGRRYTASHRGDRYGHHSHTQAS